jgi:hypothetical protein
MGLFNIGLASVMGGTLSGGVSAVGRTFGLSKPFKLYDTIRKNAPDYGDKLNHAAMAKALYDISLGKKIDVSSVFPDVPDDLKLRRFVTEAATIGNHTVKPDTLSVFRQLAEIFEEVPFLQKVKQLEEGGPISTRRLINWVVEDVDKNFNADTARVLDILGVKTQDLLYFKLLGKSQKAKLTNSQMDFLKKFEDPEVTPETFKESFDNALIDSVEEFGRDLALHDRFSRELEIQHSTYRHQVAQDEMDIPDYKEQSSRVKDYDTEGALILKGDLVIKDNPNFEDVSYISRETEKIFERLRSRTLDPEEKSFLDAVKSTVDEMRLKADSEIESIKKAMRSIKNSMNCMRGNL